MQMDRFIPNRSSSNLDVASYNIAMEMKDVENVDETQSPAKVSPGSNENFFWQLAKNIQLNKLLNTIHCAHIRQNSKANF
jgi:hypothetical protein